MKGWIVAAGLLTLWLYCRSTVPHAAALSPASHASAGSAQRHSQPVAKPASPSAASPETATSRQVEEPPSVDAVPAADESQPQMSPDQLEAARQRAFTDQLAAQQQVLDAEQQRMLASVPQRVLEMQRQAIETQRHLNQTIDDAWDDIARYGDQVNGRPVLAPELVQIMRLQRDMAHQRSGTSTGLPAFPQ